MSTGLIEGLLNSTYIWQFLFINSDISCALVYKPSADRSSDRVLIGAIREINFINDRIEL